jgi:hypothetical protein
VGVFLGGCDGGDDITSDHRAIFTQETDLWLMKTCHEYLRTTMALAKWH